jgi:tRNA(Ile)-lysidine synthase
MNGKLPDFFEAPHSLANAAPCEPILLALSGGADSSALLHMLCQMRNSLGFTLYAAHLNHNIRGDEYENEALRDELFCRRICEAMNVPLFVESVDIPKQAMQSGKSLETEAREARYRFFAKFMQETGIKILATAHNADDNLETQLFNLCRGCGLDGISGIPRTREIAEVDGGIAVRPILNATKAEIIDYCSINHIEYVTDSTNFEEDCTRNKLRNTVIPIMRQLFGSPEAAGMRLAQAAGEDNRFILSMAEQFLESNPDIPLDSFLALDRAVAKRVLQLSYQKACNQKLEAVHIDAILRYATEQKDGSITLPRGFCASFANNSLKILPASQLLDDATAPKIERVALHEGINQIESSAFIVTLTSGAPDKVITYNQGVYNLCTYAGLKNVNPSKLYVSCRAEGDKIYDGGMGKKLKKLLCDKKIPPKMRDLLPIVHSGDQIVYVPFCAVADIAKASRSDAECHVALYSL